MPDATRPGGGMKYRPYTVTFWVDADDSTDVAVLAVDEEHALVLAREARPDKADLDASVVRDHRD